MEEQIRQLFKNDVKRLQEKCGEDKQQIAVELIRAYFNGYETVIREDDGMVSADIVIPKGEKIPPWKEFIFWSIEYLGEILGLDINLYKVD